jgi:hypothetical protein
VVSEVRMIKNGETTPILQNFQPTSFLLDQLSSEYPVEKFAVSVA